MKLNYKLTNSDFLQYHLYASSKSALHKKRRFQTQIIIPVIYILTGIYFMIKYDSYVIIAAFSAIAILWFAFYPKYSGWSYKKHFRKHIEENYKNRINTPAEIEFVADGVLTKDHTSESRIKGSEIKNLIEIKNHYFLKLSTDLFIIIPKQVIKNEAEFKEKVTALGVQYVNELDWKWK